MTEDEESNVAALQMAYAAWHESRGKVGTWIGLFADEIIWNSQADGRPGMEFSRRRSFRQDILNYFEELHCNWSMQYYHVNEFFAKRDRVVVIANVSWTNRHTNKTATVPKVDIWRFRNGKAVDFMEYFDTHVALQASTAQNACDGTEFFDPGHWPDPLQCG